MANTKRFLSIGILLALLFSMFSFAVMPVSAASMSAPSKLSTSTKVEKIWKASNSWY